MWSTRRNSKALFRLKPGRSSHIHQSKLLIETKSPLSRARTRLKKRTRFRVKMSSSPLKRRTRMGLSLASLSRKKLNYVKFTISLAVCSFTLITCDSSYRHDTNVYGTTQMSVNDHEFASDTVAVIEQFILCIIAFKLVYYESGRKWFVLAYDLVS